MAVTSRMHVRCPRPALVGLTWLALSAHPVLAAPGLAAGSGPQALPLVRADEWGSTPQPPGPVTHTVTHLTLHHQGVRWKPGADVPAYLRRLQQWSRSAKGWTDVPYHYVIAPDGTIYAARSPQVPGDSNTDYDTRGHLQVMLLGNFEEQAVTEHQWDSTVRLLASLLETHGLPAERIGAHRQHAEQTVCPGEALMARFEELRQAVIVAANLNRKN